VYEFNSMEVRYRTVWPALVTILFCRSAARMFRSLNAAMPSRSWRRYTLTGLVGLVPALLLLTAYLAVIVFVIYWPIAFLQMLPVRIAILRNKGQLSPTLVPSFRASDSWAICQPPAGRPQAGFPDLHSAARAVDSRAM